MQHNLAEQRAAGAQAVVLEASSHALALERVRAGGLGRGDLDPAHQRAPGFSRHGAELLRRETQADRARPLRGAECRRPLDRPADRAGAAYPLRRGPGSPNGCTVARLGHPRGNRRAALPAERGRAGRVGSAAADDRALQRPQRPGGAGGGLPAGRGWRRYSSAAGRAGELPGGAGPHGAAAGRARQAGGGGFRAHAAQPGKSAEHPAGHHAGPP